MDEALILLPAVRALSIERLTESLSEYFSSEPSERCFALRDVGEQQLRISCDGWALFLRLVAGPYVKREAQEIIARYANERPGKTFAVSDVRIELYSDPDPTLDHINDYVLTIEHLIDLTEGIAFEPGSLQFL